MGWMCQQTSRGQMLIYLVKLTSKVRKRDLVLKCLLSMDPSFMDPKAKLKVMWMLTCRKVIYMVMGKLIWTVVDVEGPDIKADIDGPDLDVCAQVEGPDVSGDMDLDGKKKGFGFGINLPSIHGPNFGGKVKGDVDAEMPDANLHGDAKVDLDAGIDVDSPDVKADIKGPDMDVSADLETPDADLDSKGKKGKGFGFNWKFPKFHGPHFGGKKGDINVEVPDAHIDGGGKIEGDADIDVDIPKGNISTPDVDASVKVDTPDADISGGIDMK